MPLDYLRANNQNQAETNDPGFNPTDYTSVSQQDENLSKDYLSGGEQAYFNSDKQKEEDSAYLGIKKQDDEEKEDEDGLAKMLKNDEKDPEDEEKDKVERKIDEDIFADAPTAKGKDTLEDVFVKSSDKPKAPKSAPKANTKIITKTPTETTDWRKRPVNVRQSGNMQEVKKRAWEREH
jgi:hypothetical protein